MMQSVNALITKSETCRETLDVPGVIATIDS
jgi:hypothetical protein